MSGLSFKVITVALTALAVLFAVVIVSASSLPETLSESTAQLKLEEVEAPKLTATAYYVFDIDTRQPISTYQADAVLPIASVTKLFSGAMFLQRADLDSQVVIEPSDVALTDGVRLRAGETYTARELLFPSLLTSGNDAAHVLARVSQSDLLVAMNGFARRYDASDVLFADASGLSDDNVASAQSLGRLLAAVYYEFPYIVDITRLRQYLTANTGWVNNSPMLDLPGYMGGKHGYTPAAKRTAAVIFSEPVVGGEDRLVGYVVLGSDDVRSDVMALRAHAQQRLRYE